MENLLFGVAVIYCGFALLLFFMQSKLAHLPNVPGRELVATPAAIGLSYETLNFQADDGVKLHGWYIPAPESQGTLLFLHGNAGNISHRLESLALFHRLQLNVLIFDYRGYGQSEGTVSEQGLYRDAEAALTQLKPDSHDVIIFGRSLGAAVAAWLAARHPPRGLILESAFTSAADIAAELYPFLPARWLTRLRYETAKSVANTTAPVLIIHSRDDEIIPFHHGQTLYQIAQEPKSLLAINGGHNDGFIQSGTKYEQGLRAFIQASNRL